MFSSPGAPSYLVGSAYLVKHGIKGAQFKAVNFTHVGRTDAVAASVAIGENDFGVCSRESAQTYMGRGVVEVAELGGAGAFLWVARPGLDPKIVAAIQTELLATKAPRCLDALRRKGFLPAKDSDLDVLRKLIDISVDFEGE